MNPYEIEQEQKRQAEKACYAANSAGNLGGAATPAPSSHYGDTCGVQAGIPRSFSMREQAEKNTAHHYEQADKHSRSAKFFRENPAFDEFIQLVRSGAIQF